MSIRTVIFDFGGVFTLSPFHAFDEIAQGLGAKPGQVHDIVFGGYGQDGDHPWHRLERGEISLDDCRQGILDFGASEHGLALDIYDIFAAIPRDGGLRHVLVDRVRELKAEGYRLAIITNNIREISEAWRGMFEVDELFEVIIDSCEVGLRKPNPAIFELCLEALGESAEHCIFLDDFAGNIASAHALGLHTVLVGEDIEQAIAELDSKLDAAANNTVAAQ